METKRQALVDRIMDLIKNGVIDRNRRLPPEREFARQLGVSRNLLREALVTLECAGCIEARGRNGLFVRETDLEDLDSGFRNMNLWPEDTMRQLMEMRILIEVPATGLAAGRKSPEQLEKLHECIRQLKRIHSDGEKYEGEGAHWDSLLHTVIVDSANNKVLSRVYEGLSALMEKYIGNSRRNLFSNQEWPEKILRQHTGLVEAIEGGDFHRAEDLAREHIYEAMKQLKVFT